MIIRTTLRALELAMTETANRFAGNVTYRNGPDPMSQRATDGGRGRFRLTITVNDSRGAGGSIGRDWGNEGRAIPAACWHVHGFYFERVLAADPDAVIRTAAGVIDNNGGNWIDYRRGSMVQPSMASEWCDHIETGESLAADMGYGKREST